MLKLSDILDEKNKILRKISKEVFFPLTKEDKKYIKLMTEYLTNSQIDDLAEKYNLRPGMGLSAIQLGINKRYFVIVHQQNDKTFKNYVIINPKIISYAAELIYVGDGEGCLSVNREVEGIIPRYARIKIEYVDESGKKQVLRAREELSITIQHEIDHLNGILFVDHIDPSNPYKNKDKMRII